MKYTDFMRANEDRFLLCNCGAKSGHIHDKQCDFLTSNDDVWRDWVENDPGGAEFNHVECELKAELEANPGEYKERK